MVRQRTRQRRRASPRERAPASRHGARACATQIGASFEAVAKAGPLTFVPVQKPPKKSFIRVHPERGYCDNYFLLEADGQTGPTTRRQGRRARVRHSGKACSAHDLHHRRRRRVLVAAEIADRRAGADGELEHFGPGDRGARQEHLVAHRERHGAALLPGVPASIDMGEPSWPPESFDDLVLIAFPESAVVTTTDHLVVQKFLGRAL